MPASPARLTLPRRPRQAQESQTACVKRECTGKLEVALLARLTPPLRSAAQSKEIACVTMVLQNRVLMKIFHALVALQTPMTLAVALVGAMLDFITRKDRLWNASNARKANTVKQELHSARPAQATPRSMPKAPAAIAWPGTQAQAAAAQHAMPASLRRG